MSIFGGVPLSWPVKSSSALSNSSSFQPLTVIALSLLGSAMKGGRSVCGTSALTGLAKSIVGNGTRAMREEKTTHSGTKGESRIKSRPMSSAVVSRVRNWLRPELRTKPPQFLHSEGVE